MKISLNDFSSILLSPDDKQSYTFFALSSDLLREVELPHDVTMDIQDPRITKTLDLIIYSVRIQFRKRSGDSFILKMKREWTDSTIDNEAELIQDLTDIAYKFKCD